MSVDMRITLPWFIELNPSARVTASNFRYPSHRLRFAIKRPTERLEAFRARINAAAVSRDGSSAPGSDKNWLLGYRQRHKGSLHQDIWRGTAAELANCGYLTVFPGQGWWNTRHALNRYDSEARCSLNISLHVPETDVDLLTPVQFQERFGYSKNLYRLPLPEKRPR